MTGLRYPDVVGSTVTMGLRLTGSCALLGLSAMACGRSSLLGAPEGAGGSTTATTTVSTASVTSNSGTVSTTTGSVDPPLPCQAGMCPDDGDICNGVELCDPDTNECIHDEVPTCDDGLACNGVEACDPSVGCLAGDPIVCEAPGAFCDENTGECECAPPFLGPDCSIKTALFAYFGQVRGLAEEQGVLWVTTTNGLWALDFAKTPGDTADDTWVRFDELGGDTATGSILIDPEGNKWLAGQGDRPLARLEDNGTPLDRSDDTWYFYGLTSLDFSPQALGIDASGTIWLGHAGDETLSFWDAKTAEDRSDDVWSARSKPGFQLDDVDAIVSEALGTVWLGSSGGGLFAYDSASEQFKDVMAPLPLVHHLAWGNNALWASLSYAGDGSAQLAKLPVPDSVFDVLPEDWVIYPAPHAIENFDVDTSHVWASTPVAGLSCLDPFAGVWVEWGNATAVQSILTRSENDLWFGGESVFYLDHEGSCEAAPDRIQELTFEENLRSPARDAAIEGDGIWLATDLGVDYVDARGTPFDPEDDRWAHFDASDAAGLEGLQGVVIGSDGIKYFWGDSRVFALDDGGSPLDKSDDAWVGHDTDQPLWVSGVVDADGVMLVVARNFMAEESTPSVVVFDPAGTPTDDSDDSVATIASGLPGTGRSMAIDSAGEVWLGTEADDYLGNLFHWNRAGTPTEGEDDIWTPVRPEDARVWKLVRDPTGGVWGTVGGFNGDVFHFYDNGTPTDPSDDYWQTYPELGSAMEIAPNGDGWFRMPGGAGILDIGGTPRDPSDDVARTLLSPEALRFPSDLWTNGTIDDQGRFWVVDENVQVFEVVE